MQIGEYLKSRIESYSKEPIEVAIKREGVEYRKRWNKGVQHFVEKINKDRVGTNFKPVNFITVRQRLIALTDIEDLRWFYFHCQKYGKKKGHTFSQCFWGATKLK